MKRLILFGGMLWMSVTAFDAEASGFFSGIYEKCNYAARSCANAVTNVLGMDKTGDEVTDIVTGEKKKTFNKPQEPFAQAAAEVGKCLTYCKETLQSAACASAETTVQLSMYGSWYVLKGAAAFTACAYLTDPLTRKGLDGVEALATAYTGSPYAGKMIRVLAHSTVYGYARDAAIVAGYEAPDIIVDTVSGLANAYSNPWQALQGVKKVLKTGIQYAMMEAGSYLLTTPLAKLAGNTAYYSVLLSTGNPLLAQGAYIGVQGMAHYTNAANAMAKSLGYYSLDLAMEAVRYFGSTDKQKVSKTESGKAAHEVKIDKSLEMAMVKTAQAA